MDGIIITAILFVLFLFAGAVGGLVSWFRMRRLENEIEMLRASIASFKAIVRPDRVRSESPEDEDTDFQREVEGSGLVEPDNDIEPIEDEPVTEAEPEPVLAAKSGSDDDKTSSDAIEKPVLRQEEHGSDQRSLEETIGSLWAVWVGGIALALGAIFLVKYSIDQGLLGPGVRIMMGLSFSALLVALGEWARRKGGHFTFANFTQANVPAILTSAGTLGAFASIFAAYELYGLLSPGVAFIALGVVAVVTTFASLLHGPLLAGLGSLGSFITPMLITTTEPSLAGLAAYVIAVAASGFVVGRLRLWKWLAVVTSVGLMLYAFILHQIVNTGVSGDRILLAAYLAISWGMIAYVFIFSLYQRDMKQFEPIDKTASVLLALMMAFLPVGAQVAPADGLSVVILLAIVAAPFCLAIYFAASRAVIYASMLMAVIGYMSWSIDFSQMYNLEANFDVETLLTSFIVREKLAAHAWIGVAMAAIAALIGFWGAVNSVSRAALAIGGSFLPVLIFATHYLRVAEFSSSLTYGFVALVLFAVNFFLANWIYSRLENGTEGRDHASAAYSVAAIVALALAATMVLEKAALTIALALMVPAIAYVNYLRPLPALRPLAAIASFLWVGRVLWQPNIIEGDIGTVPVFNWLTYGYGIPTLGFGVAIWLLYRGRRDRWLEFLEAVAITALAATLGLVGLHAIDHTEVFTPIDRLEEAALITIIGCGLALGLLQINRRRRSRVFHHGATILGIVGMLGAVFGLLFVFNPWLGLNVTGSMLIINKLFYAYLVPGLMYVALGYLASNRRPKLYVNGAYIVGILLVCNWINLTIRHFFHRDNLDLYYKTGEAELYTYSIVWLIIGIIVLAAGIRLYSKPLRLASVGIFVLVVAKVFLVDMSGLEGFLRALSFIGLGATLIAIGLVYQRVLSRLDDDGEAGSEDQKEHAPE